MTNIGLIKEFNQVKETNPPNCSSLYKLCMKIVAENISHVDFTNLPSLIGEKVIEAAVSYPSIHSADIKNIVINLCSSYGTEFISSLKINAWILDKYEDSVTAFVLPLERLDLSCCLLDDISPLLPVLCLIDNLKVLNISSNELTEVGFRKIFLPFIVMKNGFKNLEALNVSCNNMNVKILKYILRLPKLHMLCLSFSANPEGKLCNEYLSILKSNNFFASDELPSESGQGIWSINNEGFGSILVESWLKEEQQFLGSCDVDLDFPLPFDNATTAFNLVSSHFYKNSSRFSSKKNRSRNIKRKEKEPKLGKVCNFLAKTIQIKIVFIKTKVIPIDEIHPPQLKKRKLEPEYDDEKLLLMYS